MSRYRCWCFTLNNYTEDEVTHLLNIFDTLCKDYAAQEEISQTGTPHIQGYLYFNNNRTFTAVRALLPRAHVERARKAIAAKKYCIKNATHVGRRWTPGGDLDNEDCKGGRPSLTAYMTAFNIWFKENHG